MTLKLIVEQAPQRQSEMERMFSGGQLVIGRGDDADWKFDDPDMFISRRHAILREEDGRITVTDASSGGLYVDNAAKPIGTGNTVAVEPGMRLRMGDFVLRIEGEGAAAGAPPRTEAPKPQSAARSGGMSFSFDFGPPEPPQEPAKRPESLPDPFETRREQAAPRAEAANRPPPRPLDQPDPFALDLRGTEKTGGGAASPGGFFGGAASEPSRGTEPGQDPVRDPFAVSGRSDPFGGGGPGADPFRSGIGDPDGPTPGPPPGSARDPFFGDDGTVDKAPDAAGPPDAGPAPVTPPERPAAAPPEPPGAPADPFGLGAPPSSGEPGPGPAPRDPFGSGFGPAADGGSATEGASGQGEARGSPGGPTSPGGRPVAEAPEPPHPEPRRPEAPWPEPRDAASSGPAPTSFPSPHPGHPAYSGSAQSQSAPPGGPAAQGGAMRGPEPPGTYAPGAHPPGAPQGGPPATPSAATPPGATPPGAATTGTAPAGTMPTGTMPTGAVPTGAVPTAAASQAQAQGHPQPPAAAGADAEALRAAFYRGLGLDAVQFPQQDPLAEMEAAGARMRALVEGLMLLLRSRAQEKQRARVAQTLISNADVNPLKFLVTPEDAAAALLHPRGQGYLAPDAAISWAFRDLHDHQMRTWTALQSSLRRMVDRFDPAEIERQMEDTGLMGRLMAGGRSAKLWQLYNERYAEIARAAEEQFLGEVGPDFRSAYETRGE